MTQLVYACISGHGYGHGARSAAVLSALMQLKPSWRLVLSTPLDARFLDLTFAGVVHERRPCRWDVGMVQADALGVDPQATLDALERLDLSLPDQLRHEAAWLAAQDCPVLIYGDIPASAALLASRVRAPLVWLASFGWDAIYRPLGGAFLTWADRCLELYRQADLLLACPLALPMPWDLPAVPLGLTCAEPRLKPSELAARLALPAERDRCVLLCFGGLGLRVEAALLERWPEHVFIGVDPSLAELRNGRCLPAGCRPLDLMPLVGRVITKPGYSTFCEAFSQGVGIHLIRRQGFAEAPMLERALQDHGWHRLLSADQWHRADWELDQPLLPPQRGTLRRDGARTAAEAIVALIESRDPGPTSAQSSR